MECPTRMALEPGFNPRMFMGRVARSKPSTPASAKRCCQRQIIGRLTPSSAATRCTGPRAIDPSITLARSACFCSRLRFDATASRRALSDGLTIMQTICAMRPKSHADQAL
jgi:hypothetical protein